MVSKRIRRKVLACGRSRNLLLDNNAICRFAKGRLHHATAIREMLKSHGHGQRSKFAGLVWGS